MQLRLIDQQLRCCQLLASVFRKTLVKRFCSTFGTPAFILDGRFDSSYRQAVSDWVLLSAAKSGGRIEELRQMVEQLRKNIETKNELLELQRQATSDSASKSDDGMLHLIDAELDELEKERHEVETQLCWKFYFAQEENEQFQEINTCQMEISSGAGGHEAMLFAAELHSMYKNFAQNSGWSFNTLKYADDFSHGGKTGIRSSMSEISGILAFAKLRFEAGIHRVQRVPVTESGGRIHTSTVSVAVLPKPAEINIEIDPKELKVQTVRASGAGGQHVNTTESAVRIVHLPTGMVVESQEERSQAQNRAHAMKRLHEKLYQVQYEEMVNRQSAERKMQIGTKDRSLKIRTYNFPDDRITDHRIKLSMNRMADFLSGSERLAFMINKLAEADLEDCLASVASSHLGAKAVNEN